MCSVVWDPLSSNIVKYCDVVTTKSTMNIRDWEIGGKGRDGYYNIEVVMFFSGSRRNVNNGFFLLWMGNEVTGECQEES